MTKNRANDLYVQNKQLLVNVDVSSNAADVN